MNEADDQLDDALRQVPLPEGLRAALAPEALFADAALDRLLAAVAVPPGLADRVRAAALAADAPARNGMVDLDRVAAGRDEPAAAEQWPTVSRSRRGHRFLSARELGRLAAALGLAVLVSLAGIQISDRLEAPGLDSTRAAALAARQWELAELESRRQLEVGNLGNPQHRQPELAGLGKPAPPALRARPPEPDPGADLVADLGTDPAANPGTSVAEGRTQPLPEPRPERFTLRTGPTADALPAMKVVDLVRDWRREVPQSAGFDLGFELRSGESPFIDPGSDPALAVNRPPLALGTGAFARLAAGQSLRVGRDASDRLRVEELLAAMPPPPGLIEAGREPVRLGIFAVGSGRTIDGRATVLLEVAALAAGGPRDRADARRTTLILDQAAAGDPRAWRRICHGLGAVARRLGPDDRVSVVLAGPRPRIAIRDADAPTLAATAADCEELPSVEYSDLDEAVTFTRQQGLLGDHTIVVAHSVTVDRCQGEVRELLASWHNALAMSGGDPHADRPGTGVRFVLLDRATPGPTRDAGPTFGRTSPDAVAIRRELLRQVTGEETLVARHCGLEVRFDPRTVASYRLIGYRQSVVETLGTGPAATIDLHAGETVRAVYEVVPRATGTAGLVTARLTWRTPAGTAARLDAVDRAGAEPAWPLPSPHGCELVLAATLGELEGKSPHFIGRELDAQRALKVLAEAWQTRGDVTPFGAALVKAIDRESDDVRRGR